MECSVKQCDYSDIKFIPEQYDTGYATFDKKKNPEIWFKAENNKEIIGCGCIHLVSKLRGRLCNGFVIPKFRGNGVIQKIVMCRIEWAIRNGLHTVDTRTVKKYYDNFGFKKIKDYKVGGSWLEMNL